MNSIPESHFNPETDKSRSKHLSSLLSQPEYQYVKTSLDFLQKYMNHAEYIAVHSVMMSYSSASMAARTPPSSSTSHSSPR